MNLHPQSIHNSSFVISNEDDPPFACIGELLMSILSGSKKSPRIEMGDCFCDQATAIETTSSFGITVDCEERCAPEGNRAVTMSGIVNNHQGQVRPFTLCLYMWWGNCGHVWSSGDGGYPAWSRSLTIPCAGRRKQQLSDAVFDVLLHQNNPSSARVIAGRGRGFLLFQTGRM
ncbi:MAG TPA: hypothetical protein ENK84_11500 [Desulfobulbus sp.]|nr:hypothetical protein [Desulfobulbus sp.]